MPDASGVALDAAREHSRPPRDDLVRAVKVGVEVRHDEGHAATRADGDPADGAAAAMPTMFGHFTPFDRFTEIDSWYEGNFMERIASGAFKKTFRELTPKVLFQHGGDPSIGDKVLGAPSVLREEAEGPYYEVLLLDTSYNRDLVPGLEAGLYGASFRFSVMREDWVQEPGVSDDNPKGLPERTIRELRCAEFGPVTWPAYADATAGVRSLTDECLIARATSNPDRLRAHLDYLERRDSRPVRDTQAPEEEACDIETADVERSQQEQLDDAAEAAAVIEHAETEAPGSKPTPLYLGKQHRSTATPGPSPTSLYHGNRKQNRKGWSA